jgi:flagellar hook-basal body complex protein FliE
MATIGPGIVGSVSKVADTYAAKPAAASGEVDFKDILNEAISRYEQIGDESAKGALELLTGQTNDLADLMISAQKSEIAVSLTVQLRNKAVEAYKEIMNMQV